MFDISDPVNPSDSTPPHGVGGKGKVGGENYKGKSKEQPTEKFLGMDVTKAQKQKIYANLCNSIIAQIKKDQKRQKKAMENLKRSTEGKPPIA